MTIVTAAAHDTPALSPAPTSLVDTSPVPTSLSHTMIPPSISGKTPRSCTLPVLPAKSHQELLYTTHGSSSEALAVTKRLKDLLAKYPVGVPAHNHQSLDLSNLKAKLSQPKCYSQATGATQFITSMLNNLGKSHLLEKTMSNLGFVYKMMKPSFDDVDKTDSLTDLGAFHAS